MLGMSTTDYYMMSLRQKITSNEKFTSLGKLSPLLCCDAGFQIINGIQSYGDHGIDDVKCVVKRQEIKKEKERNWIRYQPG